MDQTELAELTIVMTGSGSLLGRVSSDNLEAWKKNTSIALPVRQAILYHLLMRPMQAGQGMALSFAPIFAPDGPVTNPIQEWAVPQRVIPLSELSPVDRKGFEEEYLRCLEHMQEAAKQAAAERAGIILAGGVQLNLDSNKTH